MTGSKRATLLQGFFDDSGNGPEEPYFLWAGFIGSDGQMQKLANEWDEILCDGTKIHWWHTYSAHAVIDALERGQHKPYFDVDISALELSTKETRLAALLKNYGADGRIVRAAVRINKQEHDEHVVRALRARNIRLGISAVLAESLKNVELIALHKIIQEFAGMMSRIGNTAQHSQLFFEDRDGAEWQDSVCQSMRIFRKLEEPALRYTVGSVTFVPSGKSSKINVRQLEAADMHAWHVRRRGLGEGAIEPLWNDLASIPGQVHTVSADEMDHYVERLNAGDRPWRIRASR